LVVIVIIAILAALILPALTGAQRSAKAVVSLGNLKSWGTAFMASLGENDNEMPSEGTSGGDPKINEAQAWFNRLPPKIKTTPLKDAVADLPKLGQKSVWINPEAPITTVTGVPFCYGFNDYLSTSEEPTMKVTRVMFPAKTVLMAEKKTDVSPMVNPNNLHAYFGAKDPMDKDAICNILFVDGHAEGIKRVVFSDQTALSAPNEQVLQQVSFTWLPYPNAQP
jgi:prepilin-type processing-associated H-X9-DG protein